MPGEKITVTSKDIKRVKVRAVGSAAGSSGGRERGKFIEAAMAAAVMKCYENPKEFRTPDGKRMDDVKIRNAQLAARVTAVKQWDEMVAQALAESQKPK